MKNKLKITLSLVFILCIATLIMLSGCGGGGNDITDAYITNSNLPRTNYVVGQDLDLSKGYLTVVKGGEEVNIPFSADGIEVSGYDKNTAGEQTVTVSYGEASTSFTVKVIPRITAESFETKYFVGDVFNTSKGKLKIAGDDAKTKSVNFSDSKVSVITFDSKTAGTKTVTVRYQNGSVSYDCSFTVTVYEAANIEYNAPKKTVYNSHATVIADKDVKDGYFTVSSSDGKLTKVVPITAAMVKGYNPSLATIENRDTPLSQTLTIEYLGNTYDYNIKILFSGISIVNYYAKGILAGLDLTKALTKEENLAAFDAVSELLYLSDADRDELGTNVVNTVVAAAAVGVTDLFVQEMKKCEYAFAIDAEGNFGLICLSYEATAEALDKLTDPNSSLNLYVSVLRSLLEEYASVEVIPDETVASTVIVYPKAQEDFYVPIIEHAVYLHELMANVPNNWTVDTLGEYSDYIIDAAIAIKRSNVYQMGLGALYTERISQWRDKNDLLELFYSFFLYAYEGEADYMKNNILSFFPMPGELENLYQQMMDTYNLQIQLYQGKDTTHWMADLSTLATFYFITLEYAEVVKSSGNQLWIDLYNKYEMDYLIEYYLGAQNIGFKYYAGAMVDSDVFNTLWMQYYNVIKLYITNNLKATEHEQLIFALFDTFQSMNPGEVFGFLSSLNLDYGISRGAKPILYLDFEEKEEANRFATILREYYCTYLTEANIPIFADLLMAIESCALFGENDFVLANFVGYMEAVNDAYSKLSDDDIKNFNKYLGKSYTKYLDIYERIVGEYDKVPTAEELALIAQLRLDIARYDEIYNLVLEFYYRNEYTEAHEILLYSAFAKAAVTYNTIISTGSDAALTVLFTEGFTFLETDTTLGKAYFHLDWNTTLMMQGAASGLDRNGTTIHLSHFDALVDYGLLPIYANMSELLYFAMVDNTVSLDSANLAALAADIALLGEFSDGLFSFFGGASAYYTAKCAYLIETMKDDAAALEVLSALAEAADAYASYRMYPTNTEYSSAFIDAMADAKTAYAALSEAQKNALGDVYGFYLEIYNQLSK